MIERTSLTWRRIEAWANERADAAAKSLASENFTHTEAKDAAWRRELALLDALLHLDLDAP